MILSIDSITISMFLNYSTSNNMMVGKVSKQNTFIMLYGHVNNRYYERFKRVYEITKSKDLRLDNLLDQAIEITKRNYEACINKDQYKVRNTIRGEIYFQCEDGEVFILDLSILVTGTDISWHPDYPKKIENQYQTLVDRKFIKLGDKILSFETFSLTVRVLGDRGKNFNYQQTLEHFKLEENFYNVSKEDIVYITEPLMRYKSEITDEARKIINSYKKVLQ